MTQHEHIYVADGIQLAMKMLCLIRSLHFFLSLAHHFQTKLKSIFQRSRNKTLLIIFGVMHPIHTAVHGLSSILSMTFVHFPQSILFTVNFQPDTAPFCRGPGFLVCGLWIHLCYYIDVLFDLSYIRLYLLIMPLYILVHCFICCILLSLVLFS